MHFVGCGFLPQDGFWKNGYGEFGGAGNLCAWMDLYDPSSYLPYATKPMLFLSGCDDAFFEAVYRQKSADLVKGKVFYSQRSCLPHGHCWGLAHEIEAFFRHVLYGENGYMSVCEAVEQGGKVALRMDGAFAKNVRFVFTCSTDEDSHKWRWESVAVEDCGGEYAHDLFAGVTAYFWEISWECGGEIIYQSTPLYQR